MRNRNMQLVIETACSNFNFMYLHSKLPGTGKNMMYYNFKEYTISCNFL